MSAVRDAGDQVVIDLNSVPEELRDSLRSSLEGFIEGYLDEHGCPPWCTQDDHLDDVTERTHFSAAARLPLDDEIRTPAGEAVRLQSDPLEVLLTTTTTLNAPRKSGQPVVELRCPGNSSGLQGIEWLTTEEARALAQLLVRHAEIADTR